MTREWLNGGLIGRPGGRWELQTPALVVDLDLLQRNITQMAEHAAANNIMLRPHAKTHKSVAIARRQLAAGASGVCVAKLGEAEALADGGVDRILVTSPVVTAAGLARAVALDARLAELVLVCDDAEVAERLSRAAAAAGRRVAVLVDVDPGMGRTGVEPGADAVALAEQVAGSAGLVFAGLQCYAGQVQHLAAPDQRRAASLAVLAELAAVRDALTARGLPPRILSGGGTGTFDIDPAARTLTELQVGSYVFMDREYNDVWDKAHAAPPFATALFVQTTVISANRAGMATTDAGAKAFATDAGVPVIAAGAPDRAAYIFFGDEQGGVLYNTTAPRLRPGHVLVCVVPHCDPTVNLYDAYHVVRGDTLVAIWPIEARGCSA